MVGGAALPRAIWPRRSRWARELDSVRERHRTEARRAADRARPRSRPSVWRVTEEATELAAAKDDALRAVEQGAAGHAARRPPRGRGDASWRRGSTQAAARDRAELRAARRAGRRRRGDRGPAGGASTPRPRRASASTRRGARAGGAARDAAGGARAAGRARARDARPRARASRAGRPSRRAPCSGATIWRAPDRARRRPRRRPPASALDELAARSAGCATARRPRSRRRTRRGERAGELESRLAGCGRRWARGELELETLREEAHRRRSRLRVADGDPAALRGLPERRARDHAGRHRRAGRAATGHPRPGRRHRAAAARARDRGRGGARRAAGQRHRRRRTRPASRRSSSSSAPRGALELHPAAAARAPQRADAGVSRRHRGARAVATVDRRCGRWPRACPARCSS